jgi:hypothetical protein
MNAAFLVDGSPLVAQPALPLDHAFDITGSPGW